MKAFTKRRMEGEVVLITGATRGIGRGVAREVAATGTTLIVVGRSHERTVELVSELHNIGGAGPIHGEVCDLTLQSEVRSLADRFLTEHGRLDVLINNAGAIFSQRQLTSEGFERTWALNHNAYFLLTALLRNVLLESSPARIVNTASDAHYVGSMCWDDLQLARNKYWWGWRSYSQSKLANVLFTRQLAYLLSGSKVTVNAVHPGFVNTGFGRNNGLLAKTMMVLSLPMQRESSKGSETVVWAAISEEAKGITGEYLYDCKPRKPSKRAMDMDTASRLWDISEGMTAPQDSGDCHNC
mgnify:CR=1 FL=1